MKIFFGRIMVAATVDVVTLAHIFRKYNLSFLVNVSGKTGFPAASGTEGLAARPVFLEMESVFTHSSVFLIPASRKAVCSLQSLQFAGILHFLCPETARLKKLQAATKGISLQSLVDYSHSGMEDLPDSYMTFS